MFVVLRSVLESADQALRQKPRQLSIVSSVVRSPPPKSSVQKVGSESSQSLTTEHSYSSTGDIRTVVHTKSSSKHEKRHHQPGSAREKHSSSSRQRSVNDPNPPLPSEQLLITVTDDDRSTMADNVEQKHYRSAFDERKVSVLDEGQFEPDYDEIDTAVEAEHVPRKESTSEGGKRSRHKHSRHTSSHSDSATKSKKHKKHKKSKKHKSKSKKSEKITELG